jgi:hypothetical protein
MCLRHLPRSQPLSCPQAVQYVKPRRRFQNRASPFGPDFVSEQFQPPATHSRHTAAVSRSLGSSQLHCARFPGGDVGMGAAASVRIMMMLATLGGAARRPRNPAPCVFVTRVCWASTKRVPCRTEMVASPRRIRKAHRAPYTPRGAFPCVALPLLSLIRLLRPRPAPAAAGDRPSRGGARHHLIHLMA